MTNSLTKGKAKVGSLEAQSISINGVELAASPAELDFLDGVVAGTATASKAVVLGASKEIATITTATITTQNVTTLNVSGVQTNTLPIVYDNNTGITAFATGGQASAVALAGEFNNVTVCATAGDSVKLPTAVLGQTITVKNSGAATLAVFPFTGDAINALAANLSVDIPVSGMVTFRAIDATTWETMETLYSPAPTTQRGGVLIKASDSAANYNLTITNASLAADRTVTVPDPGAAASFMMTEGAQTINGVKTFTGLAVDVTNTITAFATGGQASAVALTTGKNRITVCATNGDSVKLPAATAGKSVYVKNNGAAYAAVFPVTGEVIDTLAANASVSLPSGADMTFHCIVAGTWESTKLSPVPKYSTGTTTTTFAAGQLTGGSFVTYKNTQGTPGSIATRTATEMFLDDEYARVGGRYTLRVANGQGTGTLTITAGSGVTLTGTAAIAANTFNDYLVTYTSATALVMQDIGQGIYA